jgi:alkanesulfonate monooxygenase SsuD/methylene tetrahydromethanopterin reductase-like flavin-dependent oxidoreductase (luciferase family)
MRFAPFCLFQRADGYTDKEILMGGLEALIESEELGYDGAYLAEHYFSPYCLGSSVSSLAAAVAMKTNRIRIGTAVTVIPLHHPLQMASDWATVDVISDGRLELGVGRGYNWYEFDSFGMSLFENTERFEEGVNALRALWTQDRVTHDGKFYQFTETQVLPRPIQQPYPPIWYACSSPNSVTNAARLGLPVGHGAGPTASMLQQRRDMWTSTARETGYSDEWIEDGLKNGPVQKIVWVAETDAQAWRECETILQTQAKALESWAYPGSDYPGRSIPEQAMEFRLGQGRKPGDRQDIQQMMKDHSVLAGSPQTVVSQLKETLDEFPIDYMLMYSSTGGPHPDDLKRCWRLFADKVMPHFK